MLPDKGKPTKENDNIIRREDRRGGETMGIDVNTE